MDNSRTPEHVPASGRSLLARFLLNFILLFVYFLVLLGLAMLAEITRPEEMGLLVFSLLSAFCFSLLFSLTWREKTRIHRGWFLAGILIGIIVFCVSYLGTFREYYGHYRLRQNVLLATLWLYLGGCGTCVLSMFIHGIRHFLQKDRLKNAGLAIVSCWALVLAIPLCIFLFGFFQNDWDIRRAIHNDVLSIVAGIAVLVFAFSVPIVTLYLQSFIRRMTWKRVILTESIFGLILLLAVGVFLVPMRAVQEKGGMRGDFAVREKMQMQLGEVAMPMAMAKGFERAKKDEASIPTTGEATGGESAGGEQKVRVREHFPETLYWNPELVAKDGKAQITIPVSDSITTFRMTCQGVAPDGALGSMTKGIRVFQDFFVDIDFPVSLTQGDQISVPVQVYNYLPAEQTVRFKVQTEDWFEMLGEAEKKVTMQRDQVEIGRASCRERV